MLVGPHVPRLLETFFGPFLLSYLFSDFENVVNYTVGKSQCIASSEMTRNTKGY
jgi:hypothetical protein